MARWQQALMDWAMVFFKAGRRFFSGGAVYRAAALSYTTLLSLVPLLMVMFSIFTLFPQFKILQPKVEALIIRNFVADSGALLQSQLLQFLDQARHLSVFTMVSLLIIAVLLLFTIEKTFNAIWQVKKRRHVVAGFFLYWAVLLLLPVLFGAGLTLSAIVASNYWVAMLSDVVHPVFKFLSPISLLLVWSAFAILYIAMPNCRVPKKAGMIAAAVATALFMLMKNLFVCYVNTVPTYKAIYGAMAVVPIFFMWIYLSWVITLFGAELSFVIANRSTREKN